MNGNYLVVADLQIPFQHKDSLTFCKQLQKFYKIPNDNIINCGDETDQYFGSLYKKDPNVTDSSTGEIKASIDILKKWYAAFPNMKLCISNHGIRWQRKAIEADIPSILMRRYEDVIQSPLGWIWKKSWLIKDRYPFIVEHGDDWGGQTPHAQAAIHNGISTAIGHHHTKADIVHLRTNHQKIWGAVCGALIDFESYAFNYARGSKLKPAIGTLVIIDNGRTPIWHPLE